MASNPLPSAPSSGWTRVWDAPVRLFHWLLVGLVAFSWWSGEQHEMEWHYRSGLAIAALLIFRIYWGFFGSHTARFSQFLRGPSAVLAYIRGIGRGPYRRSFGHNPAGGWAVVMMLFVLTIMVGAGLFSVDVDGLESGPLADLVSFEAGRSAAEVHELVFNLVLAIIALHVVAISAYWLLLKQNLIAPMLSGWHRASPDVDAQPLGTSALRAVIGVILALGATYAISEGFWV